MTPRGAIPMLPHVLPNILEPPDLKRAARKDRTNGMEQAGLPKWIGMFPLL